MRTVAAAEHSALVSASAGAEITTRSEPVEHDALSRAVPGFPGRLRAWGVWGPCRAPTQSWSATHYRGPSRVSRDGSERGGCGGHVEGPHLSGRAAAWRAARSRARRR